MILEVIQKKYVYFKKLNNMDNEQIEEIIKQLKSKEKDCESFSKKYKQREMDDLFQYYEGASWAIKFAISLFEEEK